MGEPSPAMAPTRAKGPRGPLAATSPTHTPRRNWDDAQPRAPRAAAGRSRRPTGPAGAWPPRSAATARAWGASCTDPTAATALLRDDAGPWFAARWAGRQPYLTSFLSEVNVPVRSTGGDRSVVFLWDFGDSLAARPAAH